MVDKSKQLTKSANTLKLDTISLQKNKMEVSSDIPQRYANSLSAKKTFP